ncbi:MAG TPA: PAS domain S-box protein [Anaerolineales bacterium]|nr:PAS domain S-box protein [Anaerolineales bacterium]
MAKGQIPGMRPALYWALFFMLLVLSIVAGGLTYWAQSRGIRDQAGAQLETIAELKVGQIQLWREERLADGRTILGDSLRLAELSHILHGTATHADRTDGLKWLAALQSGLKCVDVILVGADGRAVLSAAYSLAPDEAYAVDLLDGALAAHAATLTDFYRDSKDGRTYIDLVVPIMSGSESQADLLGAVVERFDPEAFLFPLIQSWPVESTTAETLLVERVGYEGVYLNALRHRDNPTLSLRFPLSQADLPAAMAVLGVEGVVEGKDYRGQPVLAAIHPVGQSPWFLVAKVDRDEFLAPLNTLAIRIALMVLVFDLALASVAGWFWRQREARFYQRGLELELERKAIEKHISSLTRYANDIILLVAPDGQVVEANERAVSGYGYSYDALLAMNVRELRPPSTRGRVSDDMRLVLESGGRLFETVHVRSNGIEFPVEVSSHVVEVEGHAYFQAIIRDVTERNRTRDELEQLRRFQESILQSVTEGITLLDSDGRILYVNHAAAEMFGAPAASLVGSHWKSVIPSDQQEVVEAADLRRHRGEADRYDLTLHRPDGTHLPVQVSGSPQIAADGSFQGTLAVFSDISGRVQQEERLRAMSIHDPLTQAYNRLFFDEELARFDRGRVRPVSLIMLDLNGLKRVNDERGHEAGDLLLRSLAHVLRATFRQEDVIARLGGDEFAVILPGASAENAQRAIERLRDAVRRHGLSSGSPPLDVAVGASTAGEGQDLRQALDRADKAMYVDKASARIR